jgi:oxygen-dependent protoporphyrinogen oxidase
VFSSLTGGVGSLVDALVTTLRQRGVTLRTNAAATLVKRTPTGSYPWQVDTTTTTSEADVVILATPASVTAALIGAHHDALQRLAAITNVATAMVTMSFPKDDLRLPPHGTGVLVPLGSPFGDDFYLTTALTFLDRKWPHLRRDDDVLVRVHVGRSDDRRFAALDDATLVDRVVAELRQILSTSATPLDSLVQRWPAGLPQYYVGHDVVVANAKKAAAELGVVLVGNAYDGVGIPASIGIGRRGGQAAADLLTR